MMNIYFLNYRSFRNYAEYLNCRIVTSENRPHSVVHVVQKTIVCVFSKSVNILRRQSSAHLHIAWKCYKGFVEW